MSDKEAMQQKAREWLSRNYHATMCIDGVRLQDFEESLIDHITRFALSRQQEWVSVSERLPRAGTEIRIRLRDGSELNEAILQHDGTYWWRERYFETDVTHWRELPEPPRV